MTRKPASPNPKKKMEIAEQETAEPIHAISKIEHETYLGLITVGVNIAILSIWIARLQPIALRYVRSRRMDLIFYMRGAIFILTVLAARSPPHTNRALGTANQGYARDTIAATGTSKDMGGNFGKYRQKGRPVPVGAAQMGLPNLAAFRDDELGRACRRERTVPRCGPAAYRPGSARDRMGHSVL